VWGQKTTARQIIEKELQGDTRACDRVAESGAWLEKGLVILVNTLNPERIITGTLGVVCVIFCRSLPGRE